MCKFKRETPKNNWIDKFVCLRSKMFSFRCGDDSENKLKGVSKSQSKHIKIKEYKICLHGKEHQKDCDNRLIRSLNHEMYLRKVKK